MSEARSAKAIFSEALDRPANERAAYLDSACSGDPKLRAKVDDLLAVYEGAGRFLTSPTVAGTAGHGSPSEGPGAQIGPYRLLREIGEGGFGTVFMAEQTHPVRRTVALKIIKLGMDTRAVIARFEAERQALAIMDHAHIARVLDAGATDSGRPYFVMELVKGDPITVYCDRNNLSITDRLQLFVQVCHAVQHAHSKGVIHRDIKPTNVLVATQDDRPHAKVIDFGVAKATNHRLTEKTLFTQERQLVGTPEYMSPEQAAGEADIDTRTDVYSLGVLLYELLTGATPFDGQRLRSAAFAELQRIIREDDPPAPSTRLLQSRDGLAGIAAQRGTEPGRLGATIRGELDWIVLRTLEKDRRRRYESAGNLAADIGRFLEGRPVEAAPASNAYRLRKFVRRHRLGASAGAMVVASLVVGLGIALWQAGIAANDRDAARAAAMAAVEARNESDARRKDVEQVSEFQAKQLGELRPALMADRLREDLIAEARAACGRAGLDAGAADEAVERFQRGLLDLNLTNVSLRVLDRNIFRSALDEAERSFRDQPLVKATLLLSLADALRELGLYDEAEAPLAEAVSIRTRMLGDEHEQTLKALVVNQTLLVDTGRLEEGEALMRRVYDVSLRTLGIESDTTLSGLGELVKILGMRDKLDEAEALVREFLDRSQDRFAPDDARAVAAVGFMGNILMAQGKLEEAEKQLLIAKERSAGFKGTDELAAATHAINYALVLMRQGRFPEAEPAASEAIDRARRAAGDDALITIIAMNNLGAVYAQSGRTDEAAAFNKNLLDTCRRALGSQHPTTAVVLANVANDYRNAGDFVQSEACYREALANNRAVLGPDHEGTIATMYSLGTVLCQQGKLEEAESISREALDRATGALPPEHRRRVHATIALGKVLTAQGRFAEAEATLMLAEAALAPAGPDAAGANPSARARYLSWAKALDELYTKWEEAAPGAHEALASSWRATVSRLEDGSSPPAPGK